MEKMMALTLPDVEDLDVFSHDATDIFSDTQKEQAIQQAGDLMFLATGVTEDAEDAAVQRIVGWGLLDMAWKLLVDTENKTEEYSPYAGERIGSYSYNKMFRNLKEAQSSGVQWFDAAVRLLAAEEGGDNSDVWWVTENVFEQPFSTTEEATPWMFPDNSGW